jgi:flagellar hook protein FlgE
MSFSTAITGLNAATADLSVISNNVANSNTTGFKSSRAEFSDLVPTSSLNPSAAGVAGSGVQLAAISQQFQQGSISATGNPLDLAINGEGFFRLNDNGAIVYTRAGNFGVDANGYVVNNAGLRLTGYQADASGTLTHALGDLKLGAQSMPPKLTSTVNYGLNLDSGATAIDTTKTPFSPTNSASYNYSATITVFDSLGVSHTLTAYFVKPDATKNNWDTHFTLDGGVPFDNTTTPPTPTVYNGGQLQFDTSGKITGGTPIKLQNMDTGNAAAKLDLNLDFANTTQYGGQFITNSLSQDGYASGTLNSVDIGNDGIVHGRYSNEQSVVLGQVALADFANQQGLRPIGDTNWAETYSSGAPLVGAPSTGKLGQVRAQSLEGSNVDLTAQLVGMINAQRNFQANAQVLTTSNSLTQTILNLR